MIQYEETDTHRAFLSEDEISFLWVEMSQNEGFEVFLHHALDLSLPVASRVEQLNHGVDHVGQTYVASSQSFHPSFLAATKVEIPVHAFTISLHRNGYVL